MKTVFVILGGLLLPMFAYTQVLKGKVTDEKNQPLSFASVYWLDTTLIISTDQAGEFEISMPLKPQKRLVVSLVGYSSDTITITTQGFVKITLHTSQELGTVTVQGTQRGQYISSINPIKTEVITSTELKKGACCDMAGCFNTNGSVQTTTTNIVTNAKELRILGLGGVYNQVLIDGFPMIQGLTFTYGISNIPGPLVESIFISKGANSVLQGWESMSGEINVLTKDPATADKFYFNAYLNSFLEKQFNSYYTFRKNRCSNMIFIHTVQPAIKIDKDNDTFLDVPLVTRYEFFDKFKYGKEQDFGWYSQTEVRFVSERRIGGQTFFNPSTDEGTTNAYGQVINYTQPEFMTKTAYRFNEANRITLFASAYNQNQNSWYGITNYIANQNTINTTLQYELTYGGESNLKAGVSYRYLNLNEDILFAQNPFNHTYGGNYGKLENIPGLFAENSLHFGKDKFTWIVGMRLDHHNQFGLYSTPRTLLKYDITPKTSIRSSIGYGWRTVNIFSENAYLLASNRNVLFTEPLKPEQAINIGGNFTQQFGEKNVTGTFTADFYHTLFLNQIFPDYNTDPTKAYISNFTGTSISNAFQGGVTIELYKRFDIGTTYNFLDVYRIENGAKYALPFIPQNTLLTTFSYKPLSGKWHLDFNVHWFGVEQLPSTADNPPEYQNPGESQPYATVNAQFTYTFKKIELYGGCENIFNFRQNLPIISWQNPFGPYFDTSSAWGPTTGQEFYIGIRVEIK